MAAPAKTPRGEGRPGEPGVGSGTAEIEGTQGQECERLYQEQKSNIGRHKEQQRTSGREASSQQKGGRIDTIHIRRTWETFHTQRGDREGTSDVEARKRKSVSDEERIKGT